jgi:hypothetical protein
MRDGTTIEQPLNINTNPAKDIDEFRKKLETGWLGLYDDEDYVIVRIDEIAFIQIKKVK